MNISNVDNCKQWLSRSHILIISPNVHFVIGHKCTRASSAIMSFVERYDKPDTFRRLVTLPAAANLSILYIIRYAYDINII